MRLLAGGDRGRPRDPRVTGRNPARETLDERYARGEIDAAEYDERRRRLAGDREG
nr:SHOCT domain-containing protein [Brooklawnia cerclae]